MIIEELFGEEVLVKNDVYTLAKVTSVIKLREIRIKSASLKYAFIGGMWYSKEKFSLEQKISLPYPFSTYYTVKILDKRYNGVLCRSLLYVKMPVVVLQYEDECVTIEFDPVIQLNGQEVLPFISLCEDDERYIITFYLFKEFDVKEKENAWLGVGKKRRVSLKIEVGDSFRFSVKIKRYKNWMDAVRSYVEKMLPEEIKVDCADKVFEQGKQALWRSYDHLTGSFLQLPWRDSPGFTFVNSSYSLLTYEAVRLHYFTKWCSETKDEVFHEWSQRLRNLFINPKLYKKNPRVGEGLVWYNMTNLTRKGLEGYFYMDCGYGGYPGGQGSIAFHLLQYLNYTEDKEVERLVKQSLEYILSTQKENGSWPMAFRQEGFIGMRPERLDRYETFGGTSECVRALIAGYKRFKDKRMKNAALKGLSYLESNYPICYNGLRDIGINEVEAFSAVSIIDAFLDAYDVTNDEKCVENALTYAYYTLTWFYLYDTRNLKLKYSFHPISYSITPRLSPYESVWIVSTYLRLSEVTGDDLWRRMATATYNETVKWRSSNGGLSEGVFPRFLTKLEPLPMEQTFATVELLMASSCFFPLTIERSSKKMRVRKEKTVIKKDGDKLIFLCDNKEMMVFDVKRCKIVFIRGAELNKYGVSFSFFDPYSLKNRIKSFVKGCVRGRYGKFILGIGDAKYFLHGVQAPKKIDDLRIYPFERCEKKRMHVSFMGNEARVCCETDLHRIECIISVKRKDDELCISFDPVVVKVLKHDVSCKQVFFPVVGAPLKERSDGKLCFDGFVIAGDFRRVVETSEFTAVDQTLVTNWTHGGMYTGGFDFIISL